MPTLSPSHRHSPGAARCLWRGSWAQATLHTAVLLLLLTSKYGAARPPSSSLVDFVPADDFAQRTAAESSRLEGLDLRILCSRTQSVEMRVLCRLTQRGDSWSDAEGRKKLVNKRSDGSSLSAFQRFVSQLRVAAEDRSEAMRQLQQLKAMGVIDENNQVVSLPDETRTLMERLG